MRLRLRLNRSSDMLIESYELQISAPACDPTSETWVAKLKMGADLTEVLPYMNAVVEKGFYDANQATLVWKADGHNYAMRPHEIAINRLLSREHAQEMATHIVDMVNATWDRRAEIAPDISKRVPPKLLEVFKLLPRSNCKQCGVPSCMAYAAQVIEGDKCLDDCPALLEAGNQEEFETLRSWGL